MPLELTTKIGATRIVATSKTVMATNVTNAFDLNALAKLLREHLPVRIIVVK